MNTKQRNYYEHVIVNMMNRFAKYINSLVDFSKKYNNAIEDLCKENNCNINDVTISQELADLVKQIESSYDKAKGFYKDLEYMRRQNRSLMDIDYLIRSFNTRVNIAKMIIPANISLQFENETITQKAYVSKTDYSDEFEQLKKDILKDLKDLRKKIHNDLDNVKYSEIINKKDELLSDINTLEKDIKDYIAQIQELNNNDDDFFQQKSMELSSFNSKIAEINNELNIIKTRVAQLWLNSVVEYNKEYGPDAAALWKLSSSKFTEGLEYISENGYLVNKISDLNNKDLETFVRTKIKEQYKQNESRGIILRDNSTLAKSIMKSAVIKNFINNNIFKIVKNNRLEDTSLKFDLKRGTNNYLSFNYAYIKNIYLDSNDILHMTIFDTVDYNYGEKLVKIPRKIQEAGLLENYYIIISISIPLHNAKYVRKYLKKHNK